MVYPFITVAVDIEDGAKGAGIVILFCALINQAAEFPVDRSTIEIGFHEVLLQLPSNRFEKVTEVPNNRIDPEECVFVLGKIMNTQNKNGPYDQPSPVSTRPGDAGKNQAGAACATAPRVKAKRAVISVRVFMMLFSIFVKEATLVLLKIQSTS